MDQPKPRTASTTAYARQQMKNAADARHELWGVLRRKAIKGEAFRKHETIGPYVVDFYSPGAKLVLLLDDLLPDGGALDAEVKWLTAAGYTVLRLGAEDVRRNPFATLKLLGRRFHVRTLARPKPEGYSGPSFRT